MFAMNIPLFANKEVFKEKTPKYKRIKLIISKNTSKVNIIYILKINKIEY